MAASNGSNGYGRAGFFVSLAMVIFTVVGAIVWVGGIANEVAQNRASIAAQDKRLDTLAEDLRTNDLLTSNMKVSDCQQFAKIETQVGMIETIVNTMRIDDIRERGLIWPKLFLQPYPSPFYEIKVPHEVMPC